MTYRGHDRRQLRRADRDHSHEKGAAMVEMAMVFSILIMLLVGTVTAAIAFGQNNSIENSAREASRFGATLPGPVDNTWLQTVRDVARAAAQGELDPGTPGRYICVAFVNGASILSLTDTAGVEAYPGTACFTDGLPADELRVQVVTRTDATIEAVLFSTTVTLSAPAAARYERS